MKIDVRERRRLVGLRSLMLGGWFIAASVCNAATSDELLQLRVVDVAGKSVQGAEAFVLNVSYGLPVCITRCGNLFGAGDLNWNRIIPGTIRSALRGENPIIRSDGSFVRDYFYVEDAVASYTPRGE